MSSGPTLTGSNCIEATSVKYTNLNLTEADWCTYAGKCKKRQLVFDREVVCFYCRYMKPLDIPDLIEINLERQENESD